MSIMCDETAVNHNAAQPNTLQFLFPHSLFEHQFTSIPQQQLYITKRL